MHRSSDTTTPGGSPAGANSSSSRAKPPSGLGCSVGVTVKLQPDLAHLTNPALPEHENGQRN